VNLWAPQRRYYHFDGDFGGDLLGFSVANAGDVNRDGHPDFIAGAVGAKKGGSSTRGMVGALVGGIVGIFIFTPLFFFVPIFGAFFGAVLGTFVGAVVGELSAGKSTIQGTMKPAIGATIGRVIGTTSKVGIAIAMWLVLTVSAFWP